MLYLAPTVSSYRRIVSDGKTLYIKATYQCDVHPCGVGSTKVDSVNERESVDQSQNGQDAEIQP